MPLPMTAAAAAADGGDVFVESFVGTMIFFIITWLFLM